jgi:hypothetical protein
VAQGAQCLARDSLRDECKYLFFCVFPLVTADTDQYNISKNSDIRKLILNWNRLKDLFIALQPKNKNSTYFWRNGTREIE